MEKSAEMHNSDPDHGVCTPAFVEMAVAEAKKAEEQARQELEQAKERQNKMREAVRGLSQSYHPYDLESGAVWSAELVSEELDGHFATIDELTNEVSLSQRCRDHIDKARRVVVRMVTTIAFFHATLNERIEALELPEQIEMALRQRWTPGRYLELVAGRASGAERRTRLRERAVEVGLSEIERAVLLAYLADED